MVRQSEMIPIELDARVESFFLIVVEGNAHMRWSVYDVQPDHRLVPLGRVNAPCHTTALVRAAEKWEDRCDFQKPHLGLEVRKWLGDPHPLGRRHQKPFRLL